MGPNGPKLGRSSPPTPTTGIPFIIIYTVTSPSGPQQILSHLCHVQKRIPNVLILKPKNFRLEGLSYFKYGLADTGLLRAT